MDDLTNHPCNHLNSIEFILFSFCLQDEPLGARYFERLNTMYCVPLVTSWITIFKQEHRDDGQKGK